MIVVTIAALCGGCISVPSPKSARATSQPPAPTVQPPAPPPNATQAPPEEEATDEIIGTQIRRRLNADPSTAVGIVAEVNDGRVVLRGVAPTLAVSSRAEAAARTVKGVKSVSNQLIVNSPNPSY